MPFIDHGDELNNQIEEANAALESVGMFRLRVATFNELSWSELGKKFVGALLMGAFFAVLLRECFKGMQEEQAMNLGMLGSFLLIFLPNLIAAFQENAHACRDLMTYAFNSPPAQNQQAELEEGRDLHFN